MLYIGSARQLLPTHLPRGIIEPFPINSKNTLYFENLFVPSEGAANVLLVSNFLAKNTDDNYFPSFAF